MQAGWQAESGGCRHGGRSDARCVASRIRRGKPKLSGARRYPVSDPVQLHRPAGVQLENIGPGHQHIDLIYFATPTGSTEIPESYSEDRLGWYRPEDWDEMSVNAEVRGWCEKALASPKTD